MAGAITAICLLTATAHWTWEIHRRSGRINIERPVTPPVALGIQLDINQATWPELTILPGISETRARRIVAHRSTHGPFKSLDQLRDVHGIGPHSLTRLTPYLLPLTEQTSRGESDRLAVQP
jgi:competence ComEA-like helix-hairpin-helix protein